MLPEQPGLAVDLGRVCDYCGHVCLPDEPLTEAYSGHKLCDPCTQLLALRILGGNRRERRRAVAEGKKKGDRNRRKRKR